MTTKTLGQVLYEADGYGWLYPHLDFAARDVYERRAQAVAAVVREQCAQECEAERLADPRGTASDMGYEQAIDDCVAAIRSMK